MVFVVALVETVLRLAEVVYAPFYALFLVGPAALLIEGFLASTERHADRLQIAAASTQARVRESSPSGRSVISRCAAKTRVFVSR